MYAGRSNLTVCCDSLKGNFYSIYADNLRFRHFNHIDVLKSILEKFVGLLKTLCDGSFWYFQTKETTFPLFSRKQKLNSTNEQCIVGDLLKNSQNHIFIKNITNEC